MKILNISLTRRYIPAVLLISIFIIMTNIINTKAILKNKEYGEIINISGKQRMLSQKLVIVTTNYLSSRDSKYKQELQKTIKEMKKAHKYLLTKVFTKRLQDIYFKDKLDINLINYLNIFNKILQTHDPKYFNKARLESSTILKQLDDAVKEYERYAKEQLDIMSKYELTLTIITLMVLLLEVIFIFRPASNQIEDDKKKLEDLNNHLEDMVKEQTKELQKNIDIVSNYVIYSKTDLKGKITEVSNAFCKISGYTKDELVGKNHNIIRHKDMDSLLFKDIWDTISNDKVWEGEIKNKKKDGSYYWTSAIITPEEDANGNKIGYIAIRHDITAKKDFEQQSEQLIQSEKMASLGEMIGNIAHQWRQPLSSISTTASGILLQKEMGILDDSTLDKSCNGIITNVQYLSKTIDTFRDFIKGEKVLKNFVLQDEIAQAISISSTILKDHDIKLIDNVDYNNKVHVYMTTGELPQVLINILNNAKDVLKEREIKNPTTTIDLKVTNDTAVITIEDNAGGIPDDIIHKIFEPYFTTKHQSQGTGLGLHMSYQIITESLKGKLYIKNTKLGAKFFIEIPILT